MVLNEDGKEKPFTTFKATHAVEGWSFMAIFKEFEQGLSWRVFSLTGGCTTKSLANRFHTKEHPKPFYMFGATDTCIDRIIDVLPKNTKKKKSFAFKEQELTC